MTGNNGKPYSHIDAINTIIAHSAVFALDEQSKIEAMQKKWNRPEFLEELKEQTPKFVLNRYQLTLAESRLFYRSSRKRELVQAAEQLSDEEIRKIRDLCMSDIYVRYPCMILTAVYETAYEKLKRDSRLRNVVALYRNLEDMLEVVCLWNGTQYGVEIIMRLLKIRFG